MAFLAAGHVPGEPGPYREAVERGIRYVLDHQAANGLLVSGTSHGPMYCHGISTLMLAEVVGMTTDAALADRARVALGRAVELIVKAQAIAKNPDNAGGWRYQPNSHDSDISVTGWQVMALRAAKSAGCAVASEHIDQAVAYLKRCAVKDGGFAYQPGQGPNNPRTGTGVLALEICGAHLTPEAVAGGQLPDQAPPAVGRPYFCYEAYYCSQAMSRWATSRSRRIIPSWSRSSWNTSRRTGAALRRRQRPVGGPQLLHRHGRPGPGGRVSVLADLPALRDDPGGFPQPRRGVIV